MGTMSSISLMRTRRSIIANLTLSELPIYLYASRYKAALTLIYVRTFITFLILYFEITCK